MTLFCVGFLYTANSNFVLFWHNCKVQEINGDVEFFFNSEFNVGSLFVELGYCFIYICFLLIVNYEKVIDISKISHYPTIATELGIVVYAPCIGYILWASIADVGASIANPLVCL
jgi:hypothetical protein